MKRSLAKLYSTTFAALAIIGCAVGPEEEVGTAEQAVTIASGAVTATMSATSDWGAGFCESLTIKNTGAPVTNWTLKIATGGATLTNLWSASQTTSGTTMTVTPAPETAKIPTNGSVVFGFCGTGTGRPTLSSISATTDSPPISCLGAPLTGGTQHCSASATGTVGNYKWTNWSSGTGACLTTYGAGAAFKATWNNSGDVMSSVGLSWDQTKTYDKYGTIAADYAYTKAGTGGGYSSIGFYGWSTSPLVEYSIIDDWFGSTIPAFGTLKGTFTVDGSTYKLYTRTQVNKPSIIGNANFQQYFSIRQTPRQCGHISVTEHFKQWASLGMPLGKMYEGKFLVEVGGGSGTVDYTVANVTAQ